jgi:hypothetical protein
MKNKRFLYFASIFLTAVLVLSVILSISGAQTFQDKVAQIEKELEISRYNFAFNENGGKYL